MGKVLKKKPFSCLAHVFFLSEQLQHCEVEDEPSVAGGVRPGPAPAPAHAHGGGEGGHLVLVAVVIMHLADHVTGSSTGKKNHNLGQVVWGGGGVEGIKMGNECVCTHSALVVVNSASASVWSPLKA